MATLSDRDDDDEDVFGDDTTPYDSISDREQLQDPSRGDSPVAPENALPQQAQRSPAANNPVAAAILARAQVLSDPAIGGVFQADRQNLNNLRENKIGSDYIANMVSAAQTAARGGATPLEGNLGQNISKQSEDMLKSGIGEQRQRDQIINSIIRRTPIGKAVPIPGSPSSVPASSSSSQIAGGTTPDATPPPKTYQDKRLEQQAITKASTILNSPNIRKEVTKLNASRSAQTLIHGIEVGDITDSKNIRNQLTSIMSTIELGAPGGEQDRKAMGVNNLWSAANDALSYITSNPESSLSPGFVTQLKAEANALGDRAAKNYKGLTDSSLATTDLSLGKKGIDPGLIHSLVKQGRNKFLQSNGYDPETGEAAGRGATPQNSQPTGNLAAQRYQAKYPGDSAMTFPKQISKNGQIATVANQGELDEASKEGWQ